MSCFYFSYTRNNCHFNGLWFSLPTIRSEVILAWKNSVIFSSNLFEVIVGKKNTFTGFAYFIFTALFKQKLLQVQSLSNSQEHKAAVCLGVFASRMDIFIIYSQQKGAACLFFCQKNLCVSVASCGDNQKFYRGRMRPLRLFGCSLGSKTLLCCGALALGIGSYSVKYCFPRWFFFSFLNVLKTFLVSSSIIMICSLFSGITTTKLDISQRSVKHDVRQGESWILEDVTVVFPWIHLCIILVYMI